jgi:Domain of unknown function (DUF5107)
LPVTVDESARVGELRAVAVENERLRVLIIPSIGAKIYDIIHKPSGINVLWHNPRIRPRRVPFGSRFDDVWSGGWDEIFPNDAESVVGGERYPDMGEVWPLEWDCETSQTRDRAVVETSVRAPITPAEIKRKLILREGSSQLDLEYEITNLGKNPIEFLWKVHPAFEINKKCRIEIEADYGIVDRRYAHLFSVERYRWPMARDIEGEAVDVSLVDPEANNCTLHYVTPVREGVARFVDEERGLVSTLRFPKHIMNNVWLFLAYGGWRSNFTAVVEPSTSYPFDLAEAAKMRQVSRLEGGERLSARLSFGVTGIRRAGRRNRISNRGRRTE